MFATGRASYSVPGEGNDMGTAAPTLEAFRTDSQPAEQCTGTSPPIIAALPYSDCVRGRKIGVLLLVSGPCRGTRAREHVARSARHPYRAPPASHPCTQTTHSPPRVRTGEVSKAVKRGDAWGFRARWPNEPMPTASDSQPSRVALQIAHSP